MSWNYRIGTHLTKVFNEDVRVFSIFEMYYDKEFEPNGHLSPDKNTLAYWEYLEDLEGTYELIGNAFNKPIIDLDNFPEEFKL